MPYGEIDDAVEACACRRASFYAQGVKTNVLFLSRGRTDKRNTSAV